MGDETTTAITTVMEELRTLESFGPKAVDLLLKVAREELTRFPSLTSDPASTHEDYAYDFFLDRGKALTTAAQLQAEDDDALGRMIRRWLRNWLVDLHARSAVGSLRDRLEKRLERDGRFDRAPAQHFWRLTDGAAQAGAADPAALAAVARRVHVTYYPEPPGGTRRAQLGRSGELEALLEELLRTAKGSLHIATLVHVVANRFPHILDPLTVSTEEETADEVPACAPSPLEEILGDEDQQHFETLSQEVFDALSAEERSLVLVLDDPKAAANMLGLGRSATALRIRSLKSKLIEISGDEMTAPEVVRRVLARCQGELRRATEPVAEDGPGLVPSVKDGGQNQ
ncbi:hypothetical protein [Arthrobacter sp. ZGTC131]|uniref:hypothetical protein n=1 Tax=Arthrobacter sp. ZGTC131 TaxID=2058898 RepID=UPI0011B034BE|nr:hypothetical protein [Arthrobacter sp. ZGTC131]